MAAEIMSAPKKDYKGGYKQINKALNICAFEDYLEAQTSNLPEIADVEQISPRVLRVLGQNAGKGIPEWASLISSTLVDSNTGLSHVLLTHWHGDHTGGVPDLLRLYPDLDKSIYKNTPSSTQQPIEDGQVFEVEGATVRAVHAPGHSLDHMCFILEEENAMFTGDNVLGHGTAAVEQLSTWMDSLRIMQSHRCQVGYPAHGLPIRDLPRKIDLELASKTRRETKVLAALSKIRKPGARRTDYSVTVKQLVTVMHGDKLDPVVRELAVEPLMEEVLRKLAEDGKVAFELRRGERKWYGIS
ncbi:hypothetical protein J7T55_015272 [Diaporthe amygdali]|uniref:uncharacterized protein n=1 Tax=Phomopsis amygdali TaxID=1214568 RepID=UPI0022FDDE0E|nr:uncharacterized protein J7T55_015272 [Diaporthe amygdali]KAJ0120543.1 hypothetical protein J7T55_015272 [Diaporthe amygdali]